MGTSPGCPAQGSSPPPRCHAPTSKLLLPIAGDLALQLLTLVFASPLTVAQATVLAVGDAGSPAPVLALGAILLCLLCKGRGSGCSLWGHGSTPQAAASPQPPAPGCPSPFLFLPASAVVASRISARRRRRPWTCILPGEEGEGEADEGSGRDVAARRGDGGLWAACLGVRWQLPPLHTCTCVCACVCACVYTPIPCSLPPTRLCINCNRKVNCAPQQLPPAKELLDWRLVPIPTAPHCSECGRNALCEDPCTLHRSQGRPFGWVHPAPGCSRAHAVPAPPKAKQSLPACSPVPVPSPYSPCISPWLLYPAPSRLLPHTKKPQGLGSAAAIVTFLRLQRNPGGKEKSPAKTNPLP